MTERPFEMIKAYEKLETLHEKGVNPARVEDPEMADHLRVLNLLAADASDMPMPRPVEFRKSIVRSIERRRRSWIRSGIAVAAVLAVGFLAWLPTMMAPAPSNANQTALIMDPELLDQALENTTRSAMLGYLENTEMLLLSMRDFDANCSEDRMDISPEKKLAHQLLLRQKFFTPAMTSPEYYHARQLMSQLESILVGVNSLDPCTDTLEVDIINDLVNENRILSKLRLVAQEIRLS